MAEDRDLDVPIEKVMTRDPDTLSPNDSVGKAISKISLTGYRLPIVDGGGRPLGVLRMRDILHYLAEHFPGVVYTLPPKPHHTMQEREGA
jgi:CBS domain-containing protein